MLRKQTIPATLCLNVLHEEKREKKKKVSFIIPLQGSVIRPNSVFPRKLRHNHYSHIFLRGATLSWEGTRLPRLPSRLRLLVYILLGEQRTQLFTSA